MGSSIVVVVVVVVAKADIYAYIEFLSMVGH